MVSNLFEEQLTNNNHELYTRYPQKSETRLALRDPVKWTTAEGFFALKNTVTTTSRGMPKETAPPLNPTDRDSARPSSFFNRALCRKQRRAGQHTLG